MDEDNIEQYESTLDSAVISIADTLSPNRRDVILSEYHHFQTKLHECIQEQFPNHRFENF